MGGGLGPTMSFGAGPGMPTVSPCTLNTCDFSEDRVQLALLGAPLLIEWRRHRRTCSRRLPKIANDWRRFHMNHMKLRLCTQGAVRETVGNRAPEFRRADDGQLKATPGSVPEAVPADGLTVHIPVEQREDSSRDWYWKPTEFRFTSKAPSERCQHRVVSKIHVPEWRHIRRFVVRRRETWQGEDDLRGSRGSGYRRYL